MYQRHESKKRQHNKLVTCKKRKREDSLWKITIVDLSHGVSGTHLNTSMKRMGCKFPLPRRHTFAWHDIYCSFVFRNWQSVLLEHCNMVSKHTFLKKTKRFISAPQCAPRNHLSYCRCQWHPLLCWRLIDRSTWLCLPCSSLVIYSPRAGTRLQTHWMTLTERYRALLNILVKSRPYTWI